ncbi:UNVERIFIED_CONTAM: hypothetical protein Scaly_2433000 [Sesamum calycinum]|uniref:CCHC-type domain-containing protein n=1 Tax=Sesamum calycinum TaxID=2727403 RepID=A0AAW2LZT5_9LAMI
MVLDTFHKMSQNPFNTILEANKFDGTNYSNWLRNLRIVLDFENQTYVLDKSLPQTLPEGPGERLTFEKFTQWHEDNRKVRSIVLSSMSNEIQKQYERYEDVWSIMHRMKELCPVPDRHIRYAVTKAFFGARMIEGSSYEATIEKSAPSVLVGEVSTSKAKGKDAGREKRKKDETSSTATSTSSVPVTPLGGGKGKRKRVRQSKIPNDVCIYCREKGHWKRECPKFLSDEGEDEE